MLKNYITQILPVNSGSPTLSSSAMLRESIERLKARMDPNIFYFVCNRKLRPDMLWSLNIPKHLAKEIFTFKQFLGFIHPRWQAIYKSILFRYLELLAKSEDRLLHRAELRIQVPLLKKSGTYFWYQQVTIPKTFDERGMATEYLTEFGQITKFDNLIPDSPSMVIERSIQIPESNLLIKAASDAVNESIKARMSPSAARLLLAYRELTMMVDGAWVSPSKQEVQQYLNLSRSALNKTSVRVMSSVKEGVPAISRGSVADLAIFANEVFGKPGGFTPVRNS